MKGLQVESLLMKEIQAVSAPDCVLAKKSEAMNETQLLNLWTPACAGMTKIYPPSLPRRRESRSLPKHEI